jgi:hypothetical protein
LIKTITLITIQDFDVSTVTGVKDGEFLPNLVEEVEKPLHHGRWCGTM